MTTIRHFIGGADAGETTRTLPVYNPATGEAHREVAAASTAEVEQAIAVAKAALPAWRASSLIKRADEAMYRAKRAGGNQVVVDDGGAAAAPVAVGTRWVADTDT